MTRDQKIALAVAVLTLLAIFLVTVIRNGTAW
jgi:hypothetical protein